MEATNSSPVGFREQVKHLEHIKQARLETSTTQAHQEARERRQNAEMSGGDVERGYKRPRQRLRVDVKTNHAAMVEMFENKESGLALAGQPNEVKIPMELYTQVQNRLNAVQSKFDELKSTHDRAMKESGDAHSRISKLSERCSELETVNQSQVERIKQLTDFDTESRLERNKAFDARDKLQEEIKGLESRLEAQAIKMGRQAANIDDLTLAVHAREGTIAELSEAKSKLEAKNRELTAKLQVSIKAQTKAMLSAKITSVAAMNASETTAPATPPKTSRTRSKDKKGKKAPTKPGGKNQSVKASSDPPPSSTPPPDESQDSGLALAHTSEELDHYVAVAQQATHSKESTKKALLERLEANERRMMELEELAKDIASFARRRTGGDGHQFSGPDAINLAKTNAEASKIITPAPLNIEPFQRESPFSGFWDSLQEAATQMQRGVHMSTRMFERFETTINESLSLPDFQERWKNLGPRWRSNVQQLVTMGFENFGATARELAAAEREAVAKIMAEVEERKEEARQNSLTVSVQTEVSGSISSTSQTKEASALSPMTMRPPKRVQSTVLLDTAAPSVAPSSASSPGTHIEKEARAIQTDMTGRVLDTLLRNAAMARFGGESGMGTSQVSAAPPESTPPEQPPAKPQSSEQPPAKPHSSHHRRTPEKTPEPQPPAPSLSSSLRPPSVAAVDPEASADTTTMEEDTEASESVTTRRPKAKGKKTKQRTAEKEKPRPPSKKETGKKSRSIGVQATSVRRSSGSMESSHVESKKASEPFETVDVQEVPRESVSAQEAQRARLAAQVGALVKARNTASRCSQEMGPDELLSRSDPTNSAFQVTEANLDSLQVVDTTSDSRTKQPARGCGRATQTSAVAFADEPQSAEQRAKYDASVAQSAISDFLQQKLDHQREAEVDCQLLSRHPPPPPPPAPNTPDWCYEMLVPRETMEENDQALFEFLPTKLFELHNLLHQTIVEVRRRLKITTALPDAAPYIGSAMNHTIADAHCVIKFDHDALEALLCLVKGNRISAVETNKKLLEYKAKVENLRLMQLDEKFRDVPLKKIPFGERDELVRFRNERKRRAERLVAGLGTLEDQTEPPAEKGVFEFGDFEAGRRGSVFDTSSPLQRGDSNSHLNARRMSNAPTPSQPSLALAGRRASVAGNTPVPSPLPPQQPKKTNYIMNLQEMISQTNREREEAKAKELSQRAFPLQTASVAKEAAKPATKLSDWTSAGRSLIKQEMVSPGAPTNNNTSRHKRHSPKRSPSRNQQQQPFTQPLSQSGQLDIFTRPQQPGGFLPQVGGGTGSQKQRDQGWSSASAQIGRGQNLSLKFPPVNGRKNDTSALTAR